LKRALRRAKFNVASLRLPLGRGIPIDTAIMSGSSRAFVPMLRHAFASHNVYFHRTLASRGHDVVGVENALRFTERAFRAAIDVFGYKPKASAAQFVSDSGFANVKMTIIRDVLALVEAMEEENSRRARAREVRDGPRLGAIPNARRRRDVERRQPRRRMMTGEPDDSDMFRDRADERYYDRFHSHESRGVEREFEDDWRSPATAEADRGRFREYENSAYDESERIADGREETCDVIAALRLEFAEVLGRVTRVEKELAVANARCAALERRDAERFAPAARKRFANEAKSTDIESENESMVDLTPLSKTMRCDGAKAETTNAFIERYVSKLRETCAE